MPWAAFFASRLAVDRLKPSPFFTVPFAEPFACPFITVVTGGADPDELELALSSSGNTGDVSSASFT